MGAWIEILIASLKRQYAESHPTMGAWIEILFYSFPQRYALGRTPRWVRGLKYEEVADVLICITSHPTMGAWIEIRSVVP